MSIGKRYCFARAIVSLDLVRLETDKLFPTKKEAMAHVPEDCKDFRDFTLSGLPPVERDKLSVKEKIEAAKQ